MVALGTTKLRSTMVHVKDIHLLMHDAIVTLIDSDGSPVAFSSCGDWALAKSDSGQTGVAAVGNKIESSGARVRIRLHLIVGAFLDVEVPATDIELLGLTSNECVTLVPRESHASGNASMSQARVSSLADQESDCTQCFPTGP